MRNLIEFCVSLIFILQGVPMSHTLSFPNCSKPFCQRSDYLALLDFHNSPDLNWSEAKAKTESWERETDCCEWEGVTCHPSTGHIIGLDLSNVQLWGIIEPNSTLFQLKHLQSLNLAHNDFSYSDVSPFFFLFPHLTYLNLSSCYLEGKVPFEIAHLKKLTSLDLSYNYGLEISNFKDIVENLTSITQLVLDENTLKSTIPVSLVNRSSLTTLSLYHCDLRGELPSSILQLPQLQVLNVGENPNLYIDVQLGNWSNSLEVLNLNYLNLSSHLPSSLDHSMRMRRLLCVSCNLHGTIPPWMWNITEAIVLGSNHLSGSLPFDLPNALSLAVLHLGDNNLSGTIKLSMFSKSKYIYSLILSNSGLSVIINGELNSTLFWPQLKFLLLSSCNITAFPNLRPPTDLINLDLSNNNIQGRIPRWWLHDTDKNESNYKLPMRLNLSHNSLTQGLENLPWRILDVVDVSSNMLEEPIPKFQKNLSLSAFLASNNKLNGIIDPSICTLNQIVGLDMSENFLVGNIPHCLGNIISSTLSALDLKSNRLNGTFQIKLSQCYYFTYLDLSDNELEGIVPKSLSMCSSLRVLNLGNNKFKDTFPSWLDTLPQLQIIKLSSNRFYGPLITSSTSNHTFPMLQILDLSNNKFSGELPVRYIQNFTNMMNMNESMFGSHAVYMGYVFGHLGEYTPYDESNLNADSIVLTFNGHRQLYSKILTTMSTFDLSNNKFEGEIPDAIGKLHALRGLNLSRNLLIGNIPPSIGMLNLLDCLDLSSNSLTGHIPQELLNLSSLGFFNVSDNQLEGPIPHGQQFDTFSTESYQRNLGLCGKPLLDCGVNNTPSTNNTDDSEDTSGGEIIFPWEIIMMGFGSGVIIGLAWGYYMFSMGKPFWFIRLVNKMEIALLNFKDEHFGRHAKGVRTRMH